MIHPSRRERSASPAAKHARNSNLIRMIHPRCLNNQSQTWSVLSKRSEPYSVMSRFPGLSPTYRNIRLLFGPCVTLAALRALRCCLICFADQRCAAIPCGRPLCQACRERSKVAHLACTRRRAKASRSFVTHQLRDQQKADTLFPDFQKAGEPPTQANWTQVPLTSKNAVSQHVTRN